MRHKITALQHLASRLPPNVGFDPFKQPLHSQIEHLMGNVHALHNLQGNPDRLDSELGHQLKVTKKKQELLQVVWQAKGKLSGLIEGERKRLDSGNKNLARLVEDGYAAELRSVFRGMSDKDKGRFIDDAIARDDANALAAILNYPYALIGWPKERRDNYRDMFIGKTAATEQYAELAETEEAVGTMLGVAAGLCAVWRSKETEKEQLIIDAAKVKMAKATQQKPVSKAWRVAFYANIRNIGAALI